MWRPALLALCIAYPRSAPADRAATPDSAAHHVADNAADNSAYKLADNTPDSSAYKLADNPADNAAHDTAGNGSAHHAPNDAADNAGMANSKAANAADNALLLNEDTWRYRSSSNFVVDGGLVVGFPAALPTGLATGVGAGITAGKTLLWGARASWATATESSLPWTVTHSDLRLRITGGVQAAPGRGTIGLRLGLGGTLVHETRTRNQGMRAGLTGSELENSSLAMLPAADLDAVIALHIAGPWLLVTSAGPSIDHHDGKLHGGWNAELEVAWQP